MTSKVAYSRELTSIHALGCDAKPFINNERFTYVILEKVDEIVFKKFDDNLNLDEWDKGKLFGDESELKWLKRKGKFHAVVITDGALPDGFNFYKELQPFNSEPFRHIYLWGEKDKTVKGWYEPRIPKILEYPVADFKSVPSRIKIKIKEYTLSEEYEVYRNGEFRREPSTSTVYRFVDLSGE